MRPVSDRVGRRHALARYYLAIAITATAPRTSTLRVGVGSAVRGAGLPYGYTITVWSTAQTVIAAHGTPPVGFIALFAAGAVTAYWLLRAATSGTIGGVSVLSTGGHAALRGWVIQACAVAGPVGAMALLSRLLPSTLCWPLAGVATVVGYLGVTGLGHALAGDKD